VRIKVIVNPRSGRRVGQKNLESIMGRLLLEGAAERIDFFATKSRGEATREAAEIRAGEYDLLVGCGGDGTINEIINGLMCSGCPIPLAILAAGTSNDFAYSMRLPSDAEGFIAMVKRGLTQDIDIGRANGTYFINVASCGMFTEVAHNTDQDSKSLLGKLAYYLKGVSEAPEQLIRSIHLKIDSPDLHLEDDFHVCLIANSQSVGSIRKLMYKAEVSDGRFDVLLLKNRKPLLTAADILYRMQNYDGGRDSAAVYFQTSRIKISSPENSEIELDLDGEHHGSLPLSVEVCPRAVKLLIPDPQQLPLRLAIPFLDRTREDFVNEA